MPATMQRQFCDEAPALDIRKLVKQHGKAAFAAAAVRIGWLGRNYFIALHHRVQPFGGLRVFWLCPRCEGACELLHECGRGLSCRKCAGLVHWSRALGSRQLRVRRLSRLRHRLGQHAERGIFGPVPPRPYGMHRRTYAKIVAEIKAREKAHLKATTLPPRLVRRLAKMVEAIK